MIRSVRFGIPAAMVLCLRLAAQGPPVAENPVDPTTATRQTAEQRIREWSNLAQSLEGRLARLLPCDPQVRMGIEEVIRASEARTSAVSQYYRVIASRNRDEIETARRLAAGQQEALSEWGEEASEAARERATTATQAAALGESAQRRVSLGDAQKTLQGIAVSVGERVTLAEQQILKKAGEEAPLRDLIAADEARQAALDAELTALSAEGARWTAYYTMRLARAQTECAAIGTGSSPADSTVTAPAAPAGAPRRPAPARRPQKKKGR